MADKTHQTAGAATEGGDAVDETWRFHDCALRCFSRSNAISTSSLRIVSAWAAVVSKGASSLLTSNSSFCFMLSSCWLC